MKEFGLKPWEYGGGDKWLTYAEAEAVDLVATRIIDDRKKAAEQAKQQSRRRSAPRRRR